MITLKRYIKKEDLELFKKGKMEFRLLMIKSKGNESRQELNANYDLPNIPVEIKILED